MQDFVRTSPRLSTLAKIGLARCRAAVMSGNRIKPIFSPDVAFQPAIPELANEHGIAAAAGSIAHSFCINFVVPGPDTGSVCRCCFLHGPEHRCGMAGHFDLAPDLGDAAFGVD
jgi:hypothetical protein